MICIRCARPTYREANRDRCSGCANAVPWCRCEPVAAREPEWLRRAHESRYGLSKDLTKAAA